ncbi:MAG: EFR1 family ferrodoxin [Sphaerochaetaceae bacterium]|jgi:ferredoxin|nr:EFR1 family ferrodoxin [Sphaerochaetaceae bacterium]MDD3163028.1 EFR1 family ferrodoxin [Sphaerochaetaceae bacterium]MDD4007230.1 EFR1 family ferrodoxin [Sphaerochaetaceae bacterium]MDD4396318.1 EFR1 family ferrodoxin [Sphaerochaetaceae bacterium]
MPDKVIICFSGTGNSYYVSKILCARLGYDQVILGPDVLDRPEILGNPSEIGVVFPTYSGHPTQNLGPLMINVLSKPEFDRLEFFFAITTCGLFPGHSLKIAEQLAMESNILCSFLDWVKMPDTYVPMAPIPSDEVQKEILSKADQKINEIATRILKNDFAIPRRKMLTKLAFKRYCKVCSRPGVPSVHASDACTGCEHCEAVCPRDAITMESGKPLFNSNCENCLACYHFCPVHAIVLDREPSGGYTYYSNRFTGYCPDYRQDSGDKQEHS